MGNTVFKVNNPAIALPPLIGNRVKLYRKRDPRSEYDKQMYFTMAHVQKLLWNARYLDVDTYTDTKVLYNANTVRVFIATTSQMAQWEHVAKASLCGTLLIYADSDERAYTLITKDRSTEHIWTSLALLARYINSADDITVRNFLRGDGAAIMNYANNFEEEKLKTELADMLLNYKRNAAQNIAERLGEQLTQIRKNIADYEKRIIQLKKQLKETTAEMWAALKSHEDEVELDEATVALVLNNPNIKIIGVNKSSNKVTLSIHGVMKYWNKEEAKILYERNEDSHKAWFKAVFIDETVKLNIVNTVTITIGLHANCTSEDYNNSFHYDLENNAISNPHHSYYNCWGDYNAQLYDAAGRGDILETILLATNASLGINMADAPVMGRLRELIRGNYVNLHCFIDSEGNYLSAAEIAERKELYEDSETN